MKKPPPRAQRWGSPRSCGCVGPVCGEMVGWEKVPQNKTNAVWLGVQYGRCGVKSALTVLQKNSVIACLLLQTTTRRLYLSVSLCVSLSLSLSRRFFWGCFFCVCLALSFWICLPSPVPRVLALLSPDKKRSGGGDGVVSGGWPVAPTNSGAMAALLPLTNVDKRVPQRW